MYARVRAEAWERGEGRQGERGWSGRGVVKRLIGQDTVGLAECIVAPVEVDANHEQRPMRNGECQPQTERDRVLKTEEFET